MKKISLITISSILLFLSINNPGFSDCNGCKKYPGCDSCCSEMGGINYCDSTSGRYICKNGYFSACYCTRHADIDLQNLSGCCLWEGGIAKRDAKGRIHCRDGSISELCSLQNPVESIAQF
jgi:hypothetical protein